MDKFQKSDLKAIRIITTVMLIVVISFLSISQSALAQEKVLKLNNKNSKMERVFKEKHRIIVNSINGTSLKSTFSIINDSSIVMQGDTILVKDILSIRHKKDGLIYSGGLVAGGGAGLTIVGGAILAELARNTNPIETLLLLLFGVPITVVGVAGIVAGTVLLIYTKEYYANDWVFSIG